MPDPEPEPAGGGGPPLLAGASGAPAALRRDGRRLLRAAARRFRALLVLLAAATVVRVAAMLATPVMLGRAIDAVRSGRGLGAAIAGLAVVLLTAALADAAEELAGTYCGSRITAWLRHCLIERVLELGAPGRRRFPAGDVLSRLTESAGGPAAFPTLLLSSAAALATTAGAVVALGLIDWTLALVFALGTPPAVLALRMFVAKAGAPFADYQRHQAEIGTRLLDARQGARTVRASGTSAREVRRILRPLPLLGAAGRLTWDAQGQVGWRLSLLAPLLQIMVVGVAGVRLATGDVTAGELVAAASYTSMAVGAAALFDTFVALLNCEVAAGRVAEILDAEPAVRRPARPVPLPDGPGALRLRGVTVRVDGRTVLDRLDLAVPPRTAVAVVGTSGSGKSVLVAAIARLADPDEGRVELDGVDVADVALPELRRAVAYAFERPALLGATVHDMIAYARPGATRAEVRRAARTAAADQFVRALPAGYDTPLAEAPMSGGELQRLGLARAALADARLLVLDDATSSLDTATEMRVTRALREVLAGRTSLVVARRPATAARADLVAWLDAGRIRALAPHGELWADPRYRAVFAAEPGEPPGAPAPCAAAPGPAR
ncbi:ATP-binding cassette domain-containing protein [Actinomadura opuntiae]|uniref:ATP-binding cassette domain-containing protein n=1 Tax=Actinomadura sp. OS1-43 TaxID=604315 RepID=UPI00255B20C9|nr:ABC transporter ATP-binding protein [Actinomadura sp. OS1-43]MDL4814179.1 ABC transporter ATP-binding protein [Actinomadura sp. OS1-43]